MVESWINERPKGTVKSQITHPNKESAEMKLHVKAFALTSGIFWGIGIFSLTCWLIAFDGATGEATFIGRLYRGFTISPAGSIIGFVWAFTDGLIGGALFAWFYNLFSTRFSIRET